jgi:hypothetical protein
MSSIKLASLWPIITFSPLTSTAHQQPLPFVALCICASFPQLIIFATMHIREVIARETDGGIREVLRILSPFKCRLNPCLWLHIHHFGHPLPHSSQLNENPPSSLLCILLLHGSHQRLSMISHASCSFLRSFGGSQLYRSFD